MIEQFRFGFVVTAADWISVGLDGFIVIVVQIERQTHFQYFLLFTPNSLKISEFPAKPKTEKERKISRELFETKKK